MMTSSARTMPASNKKMAWMKNKKTTTTRQMIDHQDSDTEDMPQSIDMSAINYEEEGRPMVGGDPSSVRIAKTWLNARLVTVMTFVFTLYVAFIGVVGVIQICYDANQFVFSSGVYSILYGAAIGAALVMFVVNLDVYIQGDRSVVTMFVVLVWTASIFLYLGAMLKSLRIETASSPISILDKVNNLNVAATLAIAALVPNLIVLFIYMFIRDGKVMPRG